MKKWLTWMLIALWIGCFTCSLAQAQPASDSRILIAYFSLWENAEDIANVDASTSASIVLDDGQPVGTTEYVANQILSVIGGDAYKIRTTEPYPNVLNAVIDQNHREAAEGFLPQLKDSVENMVQYDTVFLGYPVWAGSVPQAIRTFLTSYDFSGKTIIPFCTHDGYGSGNSFGEIAALCPSAAQLEGYVIPAKEVTLTDTQVPQWLSTLDITADACMPRRRSSFAWASPCSMACSMIRPRHGSS